MKLNQYFSVLALAAVLAVSGCGDNGQQAEQETAPPAQESSMGDKPAMDEPAPAAEPEAVEQPAEDAGDAEGTGDAAGAEGDTPE